MPLEIVVLLSWSHVVVLCLLFRVVFCFKQVRLKTQRAVNVERGGGETQTLTKGQRVSSAGSGSLKEAEGTLNKAQNTVNM